MAFFQASPNNDFVLAAVNGGNATLVSSTARILDGISVDQTGTAPIWLHIYDSATAPTVGAGTQVQAYLIPGNLNGAGRNLAGLSTALVNGLGFTITSGSNLQTDAVTSGVLAANNVSINLFWRTAL